jgi:chromosome segregation ATPase
MISLEQVRALEDRVEKAVAYIAGLRGEVAELGRRLAEAQSFIDDAADELAAAEEKTLAAEARAEAAEAQRLAESGRIREFESRLADMAERVAAAETRAAELNARAEEYRKDQAKIEEGIVHALAKLDSFEDLVLSQAAVAEKEPEAPVEEPPAEAARLGSGIAVKSGPDGGAAAKASVPEPETAENELDIF